MLEKSYFIRNNIFVWQKTHIIYQYFLTVVCRYSMVYLQFPSYRGPRLFCSIVNRETHLVARERMREREREQIKVKGKQAASRRKRGRLGSGPPF